MLVVRTLGIVLLCSALATGCDAKREQPNVVLVLVDTLRADRTSLHGYARATTPRLDERARAAVVFDAARSQASCTFPSVNSLLTSRGPQHFYDQPVNSWAIPAGIPTLAEILARNGWSTFAVSASSVVRATPSDVNHTGGYGAGFATFDESCERRDATCVNVRALALARAARPPFFAYLHYMDPHHPYSPPPGGRHFAKADPTMPRRIRAGDPGPILASIYAKHEKRDWSREVAYLSDSYDDEIRTLDGSLELLFGQIARLGGGRDTVVVLASDHGEDFLEHGDLMHCRTLHDTSLHVPLVMWLPGVAARRIATPVQNLDVVPTLLDYLGLDAEHEGLEGRSLRPLIEGRDDPAPVYAALEAQRAIVDGRDKLVLDLDTGRSRLFDVVADPGERTDLAAQRPDRADALVRRLREYVARTEGADAHGAAKLSREVQDRLRAVGYLE